MLVGAPFRNFESEAEEKESYAMNALTEMLMTQLAGSAISKYKP
jgi:hypothetical protein